eukprot:scaffold2098_cov235-Pinguiococcus_pyrenoidosus.AAC.5
MRRAVAAVAGVKLDAHLPLFIGQEGVLQAGHGERRVAPQNEVERQRGDVRQGEGLLLHVDVHARLIGVVELEFGLAWPHQRIDEVCGHFRLEDLLDRLLLAYLGFADQQLLQVPNGAALALEDEGDGRSGPKLDLLGGDGEDRRRRLGVLRCRLLSFLLHPLHLHGRRELGVAMRLVDPFERLDPPTSVLQGHGSFERLGRQLGSEVNNLDVLSTPDRRAGAPGRQRNLQGVPILDNNMKLISVGNRIVKVRNDLQLQGLSRAHDSFPNIHTEPRACRPDVGLEGRLDGAFVSQRQRSRHVLQAGRGSPINGVGAKRHRRPDAFGDEGSRQRRLYAASDRDRERQPEDTEALACQADGDLHSLARRDGALGFQSLVDADGDVGRIFRLDLVLGVQVGVCVCEHDSRLVGETEKAVPVGNLLHEKLDGRHLALCPQGQGRHVVSHAGDAHVQR